MYLFDEDREATIPLKVNTATFWSPLPNKISIAGKTPPDFTGPKIFNIHPAGYAIVPPKELVEAWKSGSIQWSEYCESYRAHMFAKAESVGIHPEDPGTIKMLLIAILTEIYKATDMQVITLCCWEGAANPHCHRKYIYSQLPPWMKGVSA